MSSSAEEAKVVIAGAGIGGLALALALRKHCGLAGSDIEVYEQAPAFGDGVGGGMGLYANGLRVLQDIDPALLATVRSYGYDYLYRRWLRHDGTEVACAREKELCSDPQLQSLGIRRWKLQKALCDASSAAGVAIRFGMRTENVGPRTDGKEGLAVTFADGSTRNARVVFGADGLKSKVGDVPSTIGWKERAGAPPCPPLLPIPQPQPPLPHFLPEVSHSRALAPSLVSHLFAGRRCGRRWLVLCPPTSRA